MLRPRTVLVLIAAIAVSIWLWQKDAPQSYPEHATSPRSTNSPKAAVGSPATAADGAIPPTVSTTADAQPTFPAPGAPDPGVTTSNAVSAPAAPSASVRLDVRAPPTVRVGDRVTIMIDAEAFGGIRNLSFAVSYERDMFDFVSSSPGFFVQQASAPAALNAEETSAGNVLVNMDIKNEGVVAAAGTVVVLEFTALRTGTSLIMVSDVSFLERGRSSSSMTAVVRPASVAIE